MLPLDAIKAPQGKKTLEIRSEPASKGEGEEGMGKQPHGRDQKTPAQT